LLTSSTYSSSSSSVAEWIRTAEKVLQKQSLN
jgi:hypothetical protein